jgi:predicted dehydrogenase
MTLRTAIIGPGKVAHLHAAAVRSLGTTTLVAVHGRNPDKTRAFAQQYNIAACDSIRDLRDKAGADVVCICTPHPQHAGPAVDALRAGMHVFIEKPLASTLADCDAILAAGRDTGLTVGTVSQRRFYEPCQRVRRAIDAGKIGRPALAAVTMYGWRDEKYYTSDPWRGTWKGEGGGVLVNQAPHQLDLLLWYMGDVADLQGAWANLNHPYIEVEDTAVAVVRFKNGGLGNIVVSNSQNPALFGKVHVFGTAGAGVGVQTDGGAMFIAGVSGIAEPPYNDLWTVPGEDALKDAWRRDDAAFFATVDATTYFHALQFNDFLDAITHRRPPLITGEDGRRTVELFTAIYRSQQTRAAIPFPLIS